MVSVPRRAATARAFLRMFALVLVVSSCGGEAAVGPDEDLDFLVGDWDPTRFVVQSKANPEVVQELIPGGIVQFSLNVQPSGQYTSILTFQGTPDTQIGLLEVDGDEIIFHRSFPSPSTERSQYTFSPGRLTLVGDTEFPFIPGGEPEAAVATIDLKKR